MSIVEANGSIACAECGRRARAEYDQLKAENAKLRKERDHWHVEQVHAYGNWEDAHNRVTELTAENAKLRELCKDMFEEIEDSGFDPYVERQGKRGSYYVEDPSWRVGIRKRVCELGIIPGEATT